MNITATQIQQLSPQKRALLSKLLKDKNSVGADKIEKLTRGRGLPLSFAQERMWFLAQLDPDNPNYNVIGHVKISGKLNVPLLKQCIEEVVRRHEVLRTEFGVENGIAEQYISRNIELPFCFLDLSELPAQRRRIETEKWVNRELARPFSMASASPLLRLTLLRLKRDEFVLLLTMHHIVSDEWSLRLLIGELGRLYQAFLTGLPSTLPELDVQYADYAGWQRSKLNDVERKRLTDYWINHVAGAQYVLDLPSDKIKPTSNSAKGASYSILLPKQLSDDIPSFARARDMTPFMVTIGAFAVLLFRYTAASDFCIGYPATNRNRAELEKLIGFFVNTLVLRVSIETGASVADFLDRIRQDLINAQKHQDLPFEQLVEALNPERGLDRHPIFQAMFSYQNKPFDVPKMSELDISFEDIDAVTVKFDLTLLVTNTDEGVLCKFEYRTDLFTENTIARMAEHYRILLCGMIEHSNGRISEIPLLSQAERRQLLSEFNATSAALPRSATLQALFEAQMEKTPDAKAVAFSDSVLSYAELNARANRLAHYLRSLGVGSDVPVGLCVERSLDMAVGLLGILKAGGAYVPLDPHYPQERLAYMMQDSAIGVLLTHRRLAQELPFDAAHTVLLDGAEASFAACSSADPVACNHPQDLAYIIYTSGSTGQPKGVMVSHANAVHSTWARLNYYPDPVNAYLLLSSFAFDSSVAGLFWTLSQGGCLVLPEDAAVKDPAALKELIVRHRVSHLLTLPSFYSLLLQQAGAALTALTTAIVAGEACTADVVERHYADLPQVKLYNEYGPTEGTVWSSAYLTATSDVEGAIPIGRPIDNMRLYTLDRTGNAVPIGVAGELYIGGEGVARGYWQRPALTAERFVPDPFDGTGGRLYKTGDVARYRADGNIEFLGRTDHQVKIRGFRVELGEIEAQLLAQPEVKEAVVLAREDRAGDKRLVAYWVPNESAVEQSDELCSDLQERLRKAQPDYMVPGAFVVLKQMPLNGNGKLDSARLPAPDWSGQSKADYEAPQTSAEEALVRIWRQLLGVEQVGRHDNFFALGGDSILSIQLVGAAKRKGLHITPRQIFENQTLAELASVVGDSRRIVLAQQDIVGGDIELTPIQHWFFDLNLPYPHHWNQSLLLELEKRLDPLLLEQVIRQIVNHHDALRLRFIPVKGGRWRQTNSLEEAHEVFDFFDLKGYSDQQQGLQIEQIASDLQTKLNIIEGPLIRVALFDLGSDKPQNLLLIVHHLSIDGVSWRILLEDINDAYRQLDDCGTCTLPAKTTSYKDWSLCLQNYAQYGCVDELNFWLGYDLQPNELPLDNPQGSRCEKYFKTISFELDEVETQKVIETSVSFFRASLDEVLLSIYITTLSSWMGTDSVLLDLDRYGRHDMFDTIDLSRTVGWFTNVHPVRFDIDINAAPNEIIDAVKMQLRRIPNEGLGYGILRYLSRDDRAQPLRVLRRPRLLFNYLGRLDKALPPDCPFKLARESPGAGVHIDNVNFYDIEVVAMVIEDRITVRWSFSIERIKQKTVEVLSEQYKAYLVSFIQFSIL